jgi:nucleoside transporter
MKYAKTRLSLMMFIQFFVAGATLPVLSLYLKDSLSFTGAQIGLVLGVSAVSSIVSPMFMTFVADRLISSERLLCLLNVASGVCMIIFAAQTEFYPVLLMYTVYSVVQNPTVPLLSAITFNHAPTERRKFGNIRVWGTIGWIAVAWMFSLMTLKDAVAPESVSRLPLLLNISAITSFVMAAYSLTIPKGVKNGLPAGERREFFPASAFKIMLKPQVMTLSIMGAAVTFSDRFYSVATAPFLKQIGFSERGIMPAMSLGQIPEIFAMGMLGYFLKKWGVKAVLLVGMVMKIYRYAACAFGESSRFLIYSGLSVHGLAYAFTLITAVICLDYFCDERDRSGVHQLYAVLTGGVGGFLGSYAAGWVIDLFTPPGGAANYSAVWTVALVLSVIITVWMYFAWPKDIKV